MRPSTTIKVWDPLVRVFHWSLVASFFIAYLTEDHFLTLHVYAGYSILSLILLRIIWGFTGPRYARFSNFVTRPAVSIRYVFDSLTGRAKRYLGHNPAAAAMIVMLLLSLLLTTFTGIAAYGAIESAGPLGSILGNIGEHGEDLMEEVHEFFANFTLLLVAIHVSGVLIESWLHGENLVKSMVHGYKLADTQDKHQEDKHHEYS
jgi:cytochrome b